MSYIKNIAIILMLFFYSFNYASASRWGQDPGHYQIITKIDVSNPLKFEDEPDYHKIMGYKYRSYINPYLSYGVNERFNLNVESVYSFSNRHQDLDIVSLSGRFLILTRKNYDFVLTPKVNVNHIGNQDSYFSPELKFEVTYNDDDLFAKGVFGAEFREELKTTKSEYSVLYDVDKDWRILALAEEITNKYEYSKKTELGFVRRINHVYNVQLSTYIRNVKTYFAQRGKQRGISISLWINH